MKEWLARNGEAISKIFILIWLTIATVLLLELTVAVTLFLINHPMCISR